MKVCKIGRIQRTVALLLLTLSFLLLLPACGKGNAEKAPATERVGEEEAREVVAAAVDLIPKAEIWNRLFYRKDGMPFLTEGLTNGDYREIDGTALSALGFADTNDLKAYAKSVFSSSMCDIFDQQIFSGGADTWTAAVIDYWKVVIDVQSSSKMFVCMMGNPNELPIIDSDECEYDLTSITVLYKRGERVSVSVPVCGTGFNAGKTVEKTVDFVKEADGWRIDNYTTVRFSK